MSVSEYTVFKLYKLEQRTFKHDLIMSFREFRSNCKKPNIVKYLEINGDLRALIILKKLVISDKDFHDYILVEDQYNFFKVAPPDKFQKFLKSKNVYYVVDIISTINNGMRALIGSLEDKPEIIVFHATDKTIYKQLDNWFSFGYNILHKAASKGHYTGNWKFVVMRRD